MFNFSKYGKILLLIILIDIFVTLVVLNMGSFFESNPIMFELLSHSVVLFVCTKILVTTSGILALEYFNKNHKYGRLAYLTTIWGYISLYLLFSIGAYLLYSYLIHLLLYFFPTISPAMSVLF